jgi:hypothetical protein
VYREKTTDLSQVTDKFITYCCIKYTSPLVGFELDGDAPVGFYVGMPEKVLLPETRRAHKVRLSTLAFYNNFFPNFWH